MDIFDLLTLIGGLALFLYGMNVMGSGLERLSGSKLEQLLEKLTSTKLRGLLLGIGVTAVIQSSSATTVMVVGFVNSGIMQLEQAIGIIMGANLGTTVTSWILSLTGLEGESLITMIFKPTTFVPVLALIGSVMLLFSKKEKKKDIGIIFLGFAVLMYGMKFMTDAVSPLAEMPEFTSLVTAFSNPFLGIIAGMVLTAVLQSSSASVGVLQALAVSGVLPFASAVPIIMGQNIGTCVTALISSIGASRNAKRAACIHLYFNILGTAIFLILFYIARYIFDFTFMEGNINAAEIAMVHTCFNLVGTAILFPFSSLLVKLAKLTIKESEEEEHHRKKGPVLEERFLETPSFAVEHCKNNVHNMANYTRANIKLAISLIFKYDEETYQKVQNNEYIVDRFEDKLGTYMVKLSSKGLHDKDSQQLSKLLHAIGDLERMSDHANNIAETVKELHESNGSFSKQAQKEITILCKAVEEIVDLAINCFTTDDEELATHVEPLEEVVDRMQESLHDKHITRLQEGICTINNGMLLSEILTNCERIADHCSNIALYVIQLNHNAFNNHKYIQNLNKNENGVFATYFNVYNEKYYKMLNEVTGQNK